MRQRLSLVLLIISAFVSSAFAQSSAPVRLEWKLVPGTKLNIEMLQDMTMDMTIGGKDVKTTSTTSTWMGWEVVGVDDKGLADVDTTIRRVKLSMDAPMLGKVEFDSENDEVAEGMAAQLAGTFKPMIGVKIRQKMNRRGQVVDVTIPVEVLKGLKSGPMGDAKQMFEQMTKNASLAFPEEEIIIGSTWETESEMQTPVGGLSVTNKHTYAGVTYVEGKSLHKIDAELTMEFKAGDDAPLGKIDVKDQSTKGALYFDADAGLLDHSEMEQDMTMLITSQGQEITQVMNQTVKVNFKKEE